MAKQFATQSIWLILFMFAVSTLSPAASDMQISPETKRDAECAICHIDWMPDFKTSSEALIPYAPKVMQKGVGKVPAASTYKMCFSCHDGFVNDSRFQRIKGAFHHPMGVKPSKNIRILKSDEGTVYPLNEGGKVYCGTCHTAHGNDWNKAESAIFMRSKNINSSLCIDCHVDQVTEEKNNHPMSKHKGKLPKELSNVRSLLGKKGEVICQTCHRSHRTVGKRLLVLKNRRSKLCTVCHEDKKQVVGSKHDLSLHKKKISNAVGQKIAKSGPCAGCHVTHGGNGKPLLAISKTTKKNDVWVQCLACHSKGGIAGATAIGKFSHSVDVEIETVNIEVKKKKWRLRGTNRKLQSLPLFDKQGKQVENNGRVQCPTCHDTHGAGEKNTAFLRIKRGGSSHLCANCHSKQIQIENTKHNIALYGQDKLSKIKLKGKKKEGICYACHKAHNGKAENMLTLVDKSGRRSASLLTRACLHCHKNNGAAADSALNNHNHPMYMEGKTTGVLPLYTRNGKRVKKNSIGRIDCATCHDVHQWDPKNPGSKQGKNLKVAATGRNSFLRMTADGDSKLCIRCHKKQGQIAGTDHDFRVSANYLKNKKQQNIEQSGVCGQCHTSHNNKSSVAIWARELGQAKDIQSSLCRSCHTKNHRETNKTVPLGKHPENVVLWSSPRRKIPGLSKGDSIPLYTVAGKKAKFGIITCPSCHDAHQWKGSKPGKGPGKEMEGTSMTSFLRRQSIGRIVCADCHGLDALYRYQYFHSDTNKDTGEKKQPLYIDQRRQR